MNSGKEQFYNNVVLNKEIIRDIEQFMDMEKRKKYKQFGIEVPSGLLLYGPPGTGKTHIARYMAEVNDFAFFNVSGSEFIEKYVGVGAKRVRTLYSEARESAKENLFHTCIIFIDEIDAIGSKRNDESNTEAKNTLNQLLIEMDGLQTKRNKGFEVITIGATNRRDILDPAILRPGRFDKQIHVDVPDYDSRVKLFELYLNKITKKRGLNTKQLSEITEGITGAEIANIVNEAAMYVIDNGRNTLVQNDLIKMIKKFEYDKRNEYKKVGFCMS